jgi:hypothetical protein
MLRNTLAASLLLFITFVSVAQSAKRTPPDPNLPEPVLVIVR